VAGDGGHQPGGGAGAELAVQFGAPRGPLAGEGARRLLALAGVEGGLAGQLVGDRGRGIVPVRGAIAGEELLVAGLDGGAAAGEVADHPERHAVDLADRLAAAGGVGAWPSCAECRWRTSANCLRRRRGLEAAIRRTSPRRTGQVRPR
jgi:hypothetical protein